MTLVVSDSETKKPLESYTPSDGLVLQERLMPNHIPHGKQDGSEANFFGYPKPDNGDLNGL